MEPTPNGTTHVIRGLLIKALHNLALGIAARPKVFLFVPLAVTAISALAILRIDFSTDVESMFVGKGTRIDEAYRMFRKYFGGSDGTGQNFQPVRTVDVPAYARIIVMVKCVDGRGDDCREGGNIFEEDAYEEVLKVHSFVTEMSLPPSRSQPRKVTNHANESSLVDGGDDYKTLCARWNGNCVPNPAIQIAEMLPRIRANETEFTFPTVLRDDEDFFSSGDVVFLAGTIAKPKLSYKAKADGSPVRRDPKDFADSVVTSSPGVLLNYILDGSTPEKLRRAKEWELKLEAGLQEMRKTLKNVDVSCFTSATLGAEFNKIALNMIPVSAYGGVSLTIFAVLSGVMRDRVQSKPFVSLAGMATVTLSMVTTIGICCLIGVTFSVMSLSGSLVLLGVGFDDTFVLLAAWRNTCKTESAANRLAEAYSEAAVSLFITSLTDSVCFFIGSMTPYPGINYFCLVLGIGMLVLLAYQVTFFGALFFFMGKAECENKDGLTFRPLSITEGHGADSKKTGWGLPWKMDYSVKPADLTKSSEPALTKFFRDVWGRWLVTPLVQLLVILGYVMYLTFAIQGALDLRTTFERRFLTSGPNVQVASFFSHEEKYFLDWPGRVMVGVFGEIDYSNKTIQRDMELLLGNIENNRYFADSIFTESWLREFLQLVKINSYYEEMDIDTEESFIRVLKQKYVVDTDGPSTDVALNADGTKIVASRFILQLSNFEEYDDFRSTLAFLWKLCDFYSDRYDIRVYHPAFKWSEQVFDTLKYTVITTASAFVSVMVIAYVLIPNPSVCVWIAVSIASVTLGIVGFMWRWGVSLSLISMIGILFGTGFSVDFVAHIAYGFSVSKEASPEGRARDALHKMGVPVFQACASTMLGTIFLVTFDGYMEQCIFRIVTLVMAIGLLHGLVFFPVLLITVSRISSLWKICGSKQLTPDCKGGEIGPSLPNNRGKDRTDPCALNL